ncbi:phosphoribosylglycinamide formyltransferase [Prevotella sp. A2931]|uniref:Phosphoribosylglycinamide formyltransferase n=1 Tax=Prevotella illustrans TaxID=2800387 RepID=A0ABS3M2K3_9BACT|nr:MULTISPECIES: phosphoribosylglycinamide formyltransferase [Prevotella]MBO1362417.1 phosphoribosylglycinamide formyltransferase [Prevotella illustrans]PTL25070.1 phosphoribosylglycinamide formyltransferase [Prevotella sp. oral taxon 820]
MSTINIAIFASGNGTNCENIIRYFKNSETIRVALVVSDKSRAYVLQRAERLQIETRIISKADLSNAEILLPLLRDFDIQFIVLAGFLQMIPAYLIRRYRRKMINIHPSLLPKFGGKGMYGIHVHEAVFMAREKETGMTVHWVSEQCDGGEIIAQYKTPLSSSDTIETIAAKEHELEMAYFPKVVESVVLDSCRL